MSGMTRTVVGEAEAKADLLERVERLERILNLGDPPRRGSLDFDARAKLAEIQASNSWAILTEIARKEAKKPAGELAHVTDCDGIEGSFAGSVGPV